MKYLYKISLTLTVLFAFSAKVIFSQEIKKLPETINFPGLRATSPYINYAGNKLVFVRMDEERPRIYETEKDADGNWIMQVPLKIINRMDSTMKCIFQAPAYNHDATELYFSVFYESKDSSANIYHTFKKNGEWQKPTKLPTVINSTGHETDPSISPDGKTLYFARQIVNDELKKFDCYAIYRSQNIEGVWQTPQTLPEPVNDGCDRAPRIMPDGKTIFMRSVRNDGATGTDIYYAKEVEKNVWLSPILVSEFSTPADDMYPSVDVNGNIYFQRAEGTREKDPHYIWQGKLPQQFQLDKILFIKGKISDLNTNIPLKATIKLIDPGSSVVLAEYKNDDITGEYSFALPQGRKYRLDFHAQGYSHTFRNTDTRNLKENTTETFDIQLYSKVNLILNIYDAEIYEPLNADLKVTNIKTGGIESVKPEKLSYGRFRFTLPLGTGYRFEASQKHYETAGFELDLSDVVVFDEFERDIELAVSKIDVEINLTDEATGAGVETDIVITNLSTNERIVTNGKTDADGKLKIKLRDGENYEISVTPKGYGFYNTTLDLTDERRNNRVDAKLTPLTTATTIKLNNINFESNSADINEGSFTELENVLKLLKINTQLKIEISAHTDDVGSDTYNLKLSEKRAGSVVEYLMTNGISVNNLIAKGYGESAPAFKPANTDQNRALNRRVELKVVEVTNE